MNSSFSSIEIPWRYTLSAICLLVQQWGKSCSHHKGLLEVKSLRPFTQFNVNSVWEQLLAPHIYIFIFSCPFSCPWCLLPQPEMWYYGNLLSLFAHHLTDWGSQPKWLSGSIYYYCVYTFDLTAITNKPELLKSNVRGYIHRLCTKITVSVTFNLSRWFCAHLWLDILGERT